MRFMMQLLALFSLLAVSLVVGTENTHDSCEPLTITCLCGTGANTTYVPLKLETRTEDLIMKPGKKCMVLSDPYQACANISCHFTLNGPSSGSHGKDFLSNFYPMEIHIPAGGFHDGGHRWVREAAPCQIPPLKNAAIKCWKWPSWITCDVSCIYGHAISDAKESVTKKSVNCRLTENVWKPQEIQDCKPYLNCKARLVKPGTLKCKEPISEPAYCEISCLDYDDFDATSLSRYQCVDETFGKTLPHCAVLKSGVPTIRKPQ